MMVKPTSARVDAASAAACATVGLVERVLALMALVLLAASCGDDKSGSAAGQRSDVREDPLVACGPATDGFPASALDGPADAERADTPEAAGLRDLIANPDGIGELPEEGWRLLRADNERAMFMADTPLDGSVLVTLRPEDGKWAFAGSGGCNRLMVVPPGGASIGYWWLDPAEGAQTGTTELKVFATDPNCASGRPTGDRLNPPTVQMTEKSVVITFTAEPITGNQNCPGHPPTPFTVDLGSPVGDRQLLDGAYWPPRPPHADF